MNKFAKTMCFIGGANLDILEKCPTEKNGFIAVGVGIINVCILSLIVMILNMYTIANMSGPVSIIISIFYGFIIFVGYWGILSVIRKTTKYSSLIKLFTFLTIIIFSFIGTMSVKNYFFVSNTFSYNETFSDIIKNHYGIAIFYLVMIFVYVLPLVLRILINSSTYEEEKEKMEHNFAIQKEADVIAYKEKYGSYASSFNEANIKMESIKQLGDLSKEYHKLLETLQKETFDFINRIEKSSDKQKNLLDECKNNVEIQFQSTLGKMSRLFSSV